MNLSRVLPGLAGAGFRVGVAMPGLAYRKSGTPGMEPRGRGSGLEKSSTFQNFAESLNAVDSRSASEVIPVAGIPERRETVP